MRYILAIDQSTQGTKALLFDQNGKKFGRKDIVHKQIIDQNGWISHDPEEIYHNVVQCVSDLVREFDVDTREIACMGISNQRETSVVWEKTTGAPICDAIVWQCARAKAICEAMESVGLGETVREKTGIPISPYYPAAKWAWILQNVSGALQKNAAHELCFGTIDTWLIYCLTKGGSYKTDYSNASRTQLFNLSKLQWDRETCDEFGISANDLPEVCDSDSVFGMTDLDGVLANEIPICGVAGDSHAALFGQGGICPGVVKATYGTGSSVMMNIGKTPLLSTHGLVTSLAWKVQGQVSYVMEGNINYTGSVITWMQNSLGLIDYASQTQTLAEEANPNDTTYYVPAFTGLGAPYWINEAKAIFCGITRLTGRAELVKAGLESIAYQIADVVLTMEKDTGITIEQLRVDGGPTRNGYLMQFQSDILNRTVIVPEIEELSARGVALMAGNTMEMFCAIDVLGKTKQIEYLSTMPAHVRTEKYAGWKNAISKVM